MTTWVRVGIAAALSACSSRTPSERERALERIPATAKVILAADGPSLSAGAFRILADSLSPHVPPSLACVVEAAQTSEALVAGASLESGATIVLVTRATVANCPALSRLDESMYVATIGGTGLASDRAHSILEDPIWARARPYMLREPLALAAELPTTRLIAVAQPDPLAAWVAIDASDPDALGKPLSAQLMRWPDDLVSKLKVRRNGTQIMVRSDSLTAEDLVRIVSDVIALGEEAPPRPLAGLAPQFKTASVPTLLRDLAGVHSAAVVEAGEVVGIRLLDPPPPPLRAGDIILGVGSHRVVDSEQLAQLADKLGRRVALAVRRDGIDSAIELAEGPP